MTSRTSSHFLRPSLAWAVVYGTCCLLEDVLSGRSPVPLDRGLMRYGALPVLGGLLFAYLLRRWTKDQT